jgi:hypothetical protein
MVGAPETTPAGDDEIERIASAREPTMGRS